MWLFGRKKESKPQESEFEKDVRELLNREDIQCRQDICEAEYAKALKLLEKPTQETILCAYDIMGNLAGEFEYAQACCWMGDFAENAKEDLKEAVYWYKRAADLGDGSGARCYADMLMTGRGAARDLNEALKYYTMAANQGIPEAAFVCGEIYRNSGMKDKALEAYQTAVRLGYPQAQIRIDQMK